MFLVLERCRRRLFLVENCVFGAGTLPQAPFLVFGAGTLPQAPFFGGKLRFGSRNVAAGAFVVKNEGKCEPPPKNYFSNCVPSKSLINWFKTLISGPSPGSVKKSSKIMENGRFGVVR